MDIASSTELYGDVEKVDDSVGLNCYWSRRNLLGIDILMRLS